jgi:hypothetical protein
MICYVGVYESIHYFDGTAPCQGAGSLPVRKCLRVAKQEESGRQKLTQKNITGWWF